MNRLRHVPFALAASASLILALSLAGCGSKSTSVSARFTQSATAEAPGLVKLVQSGGSGQRLVLTALLIGPEPALDLNEFRFGIKIQDPTLVKFVPQASYMQTALVAGDGQTIAIDVDGSDASLIQIDVRKLGGGTGNGVAAAAATVIQVSFDVQGSGSTTLNLTGLGATQPQALDSARNPIPAVVFDAANAGVVGVTTGGGGY